MRFAWTLTFNWHTAGGGHDWRDLRALVSCISRSRSKGVAMAPSFCIDGDTTCGRMDAGRLARHGCGSTGPTCSRLRANVQPELFRGAPELRRLGENTSCGSYGARFRRGGVSLL